MTILEPLFEATSSILITLLLKQLKKVLSQKAAYLDGGGGDLGERKTEWAEIDHWRQTNKIFGGFSHQCNALVFASQNILTLGH